MLVDDLAFFFVQAGIEDGKLFEHRYEEFDQERHVGQADAALLCHRFQSLAQGYQCAAIDLIKGRSMRDGAPGTLHVFRDTLAQACQWLTLVLTSRNSPLRFLFSHWRRLRSRLFLLCRSRWGCWGCRGCGFGSFSVGSYIFKGDATVRIRGRHLLKVNPQLEGEFAYGRGGKNAWSSRHRCLLGRWYRRWCSRRS